MILSILLPTILLIDQEIMILDRQNDFFGNQVLYYIMYLGMDYVF